HHDSLESGEQQTVLSPAPLSGAGTMLACGAPTRSSTLFVGGHMLRNLGILILSVLSRLSTASAQVPAFPASFTTREMPSNGTTLHVRIGGSGPAVVLLHGFGNTGDMWAPLAADLVRDHTVIVPDLRGFGLSARPADGYDKMTEAADVVGVLDALHV